MPLEEIHHLFHGIGLDKRVIDEHQMQYDNSITQFILVLLLEWTKNTNVTYKLLTDVLQEYLHYTLDIDEVWYHMDMIDKYIVCITVWPELL